MPSMNKIKVDKPKQPSSPCNGFSLSSHLSVTSQKHAEIAQL